MCRQQRLAATGGDTDASLRYVGLPRGKRPIVARSGVVADGRGTRGVEGSCQRRSIAAAARPAEKVLQCGERVALVVLERQRHSCHRAGRS